MQEQTAPEQTAQAADVQLQIQDLLLCAQVIQLASQRGAFKPEEFTQIGGLFDRLVAFLKASGALQTTASSAPTSGETVEQSSAE